MTRQAPAHSKPEKAKVTIKDVAAAAGVHYSTVSLALRGHRRIPTKTQKRICKIAETLGYRRDPVMLALSSRRRGIVAPSPRPRLLFVTNRVDQAELYNTPHMGLFIDGARDQALRLGFDFEIFLCGDPTPTDLDLNSAFASRVPAGVIVGALLGHRRSLNLDLRQTPAVRIDSAFAFQDRPMVSNDQLQVTVLAWERLHRLGYRRLGLAVGRVDEENTHNRFTAGQRLACEALGLPFLAPCVFARGEDDVAAAKRLRAWLSRERPDVVASNWRSIRALVKAAGKRVPADLGVACLCLDAPDAILTGVIQNHRTVGARAVDVLAIEIQNHGRSPASLPGTTFVGGTWNEGRSTPAPQ